MTLKNELGSLGTESLIGAFLDVMGKCESLDETNEVINGLTRDYPAMHTLLDVLYVHLTENGTPEHEAHHIQQGACIGFLTLRETAEVQEISQQVG